MSLVAASVIALFTFSISAVTGFGAGIMAVPILSLFFPLTTVSPFMNLAGFFANAVRFKKNYHDIKFKVILPLFIGNFVGMVLGIYFLTSVPNSYLTKILSVVTVLTAITFLLDKNHIRFRPNRIFGVIVGMVSGILAALFATPGPPILLYLSGFMKDRHELRSHLFAYFFLSGFVVVPILFINKLVTREVIMLFLISIPIIILANSIGEKMHLRMSETVFRRIIAVILIASSIQLFLR